MNNPVYFFHVPETTLDKNHRVILYYHGPLSTGYINQLAANLKKQLDCSKQLVWRIYSVFVEMTQNMYYHSEEQTIAIKNEPIGMVYIEEDEKQYAITAANLASSKSIRIIEERCDAINEMNMEELRAYKNAILLQSVNEKERKGGNVGLLQIALIAEGKINFQINYINQSHSFLSLTTVIKKMQN